MTASRLPPLYAPRHAMWLESHGPLLPSSFCSTGLTHSNTNNLACNNRLDSHT